MTSLEWSLKFERNNKSCKCDVLCSRTLDRHELWEWGQLNCPGSIGAVEDVFTLTWAVLIPPWRFCSQWFCSLFICTRQPTLFPARDSVSFRGIPAMTSVVFPFYTVCKSFTWSASVSHFRVQLAIQQLPWHLAIYHRSYELRGLTIEAKTLKL